MKVAAIQMTSTRDVAANLREAGRLVADAAKQGAKLVVLPENFSFLGATDADRVAAIEAFGDGPAQRFLAETAESLGLWLVGGTIPIRDGGDRASSRSLLVNALVASARWSTSSCRDHRYNDCSLSPRSLATSATDLPLDLIMPTASALNSFEYRFRFLLPT